MEYVLWIAAALSMSWASILVSTDSLPSANMLTPMQVKKSDIIGLTEIE